MKVTDYVKNVRRVHVELSAGEVRRLIYDKVADTLGTDVDSVVERLRVDLSDGASATTYVRGELPVSRDQLLESLGLTPTEPVETDGAAVAEGLGDHVTGTSDVVETPETVAAFNAVAGDLDQLGNESDDLASRLAYVGRVSPEEVAHFKHVAERSLLADPTNPTALSLAKVVAALEKPWRPGPAVGGNPGVQVGTGEYAPQSEELPEVQVDRPESPATLTVQSVLDDLSNLTELLGRALQTRDNSPFVERATVSVETLLRVLGKYRDCVLVEGGDFQRVVPRPVSEDSLQSARLKLAELVNSPRRPEGRATATDLHYVLALLGGVL